MKELVTDRYVFLCFIIVWNCWLRVWCIVWMEWVLLGLFSVGFVFVNVFGLLD